MFRKSKDDRKKKPKLPPITRDIINFWETSIESDISDILGSYTGRASGDDDVPEQDPDDL